MPGRQPAMMKKLGRAPGLIGYYTDIKIRRRQEGEPPFVKFVRVRTVLYLALIIAVGVFMLYTLANGPVFGLAVIHDRNPLAVLL